MKVKFNMKKPLAQIPSPAQHPNKLTPITVQSSKTDFKPLNKSKLIEKAKTYGNLQSSRIASTVYNSFMVNKFAREAEIQHTESDF